MLSSIPKDRSGKENARKNGWANLWWGRATRTDNGALSRIKSSYCLRLKLFPFRKISPSFHPHYLDRKRGEINASPLPRLRLHEFLRSPFSSGETCLSFSIGNRKLSSLSLSLSLSPSFKQYFERLEPPLRPIDQPPISICTRSIISVCLASLFDEDGSLFPRRSIRRTFSFIDRVARRS